MKRILLSIILSMSLSSAFASTEESAEKESWIEDFLETLGADGQFDPDKLIDFSFLPGPFYDPETSLGLGLSAVGLYQVDPNDTVSELSNLTISGFVSVNGSVALILDNKTFLNQDKQRFYLNMHVANAPEVYYGVGYQENNVSDNKINYDYTQFQANPRWLQRLSPTSFVGVGFDYSYASAENFDRLSSSVDYTALQDSSRAVGFNLLLNYDTRDQVLNAEDGRLLEVDSFFYRQYLGSRTDFDIHNLLYSEYRHIARESDVLAWQVRAQLTDGDVPWDKLSKIGSSKLLRGYNIGRYRDKQMLMSQVEYRLDLPRRHGMVFWVGAGMIADKVSNFSTKEILPNTGIGYRFEVKPRVNLRLDLAFAKDEVGFYFNVNEAF